MLGPSSWGLPQILEESRPNRSNPVNILGQWLSELFSVLFFLIVFAATLLWQCKWHQTTVICLINHAVKQRRLKIRKIIENNTRSNPFEIGSNLAPLGTKCLEWIWHLSGFTGRYRLLYPDIGLNAAPISWYSGSGTPYWVPYDS